MQKKSAKIAAPPLKGEKARKRKKPKKQKVTRTIYTPYTQKSKEIPVPAKKPEQYLAQMKLIRSGNFCSQTIREVAKGIKPILRAKLLAELIEAELKKSGKPLDWEVLPPEELGSAKIRHYYSDVLKLDRFDQSRLEMLQSLQPKAVWRGRGKFRAYHVFEYDFSEAVVLECPKVGNAMYILGKEWKSLSRLSKKALLDNYGDQTTRLTHHGITAAHVRKTLLAFYRIKSSTSDTAVY